VTLREGDEVILASAGGGGYGPPGERPLEHVLEDVREGFVSPQAAQDGYGVEVDG
jgi:N-methylhydantoinase B